MTQTITKADRKRHQLANHYKAIEKLISLCGGSKLQTKTISNRLRALEYKYNKLAVDYANGKISTNQWGILSDEAEAEVQKLFNNKLQGLHINADPRGYTLKIDDEINRTIYGEIGLLQDWGNYGLLAPEITGN